MKKPLHLIIALVLLIFCSCERSDFRRRTSSRFRAEEIGRFIRTNNEGRVEVGRYVSSDYDGELCNSTEDQEREECEESCETVYGRDSDQCKNLPVDLINILEELYKNLQSPQQIRDGEDALHTQVDEYSFGVMIDISIEPMLRLIRQWNNREAKEFLIWLARSPGASLGILEHDPSQEILPKVFGKVVSHSVVADIVKYGVAEDLRGFGETFLVLAEVVKNIPAFVLIHDLTDKFCSDTECKLQYYCVNIKNERSPSYRSQCAYFRSSRFTFSNVDYCYVHGPNVWSYWSYLHKQGLIVDTTFKQDFEITGEVCNNTCAANISLCEKRE